MNPATHSHPQADGDRRPIGYSGPVRVVTGTAGPAFGPPASHVLMARDAAVTALVEPMARMLYQAFQAHQLGLFDCIEFDDLSIAAKTKLVEDARCALHLQSPLYKAEAERQAKLTFTEALENVARHYPFLNPVADDREEARRKQAIDAVIKACTLLELPALMSVAHRMALTGKLQMSDQKQVTLTTLRGVRA